MKRYQCIKTIRHELFEFEPGSIYNFTVNPGGNFYGHKTQTGRIIWLTSQQIRDHFQELLDLHVDDVPDDQYSNPMDADFISGLSATKGCLIACVITLGIFIATIMIWG